MMIWESQTKIQTSESQRSETSFSLVMTEFFDLFKYMLQFVGKQAAVSSQVLERKPNFYVLMITNVG